MNEQSLNNLNEEQKWHLEKEGLEARVRNQLGPFPSLLELVKLYKDNKEEDKKSKIFSFIQSGYKISLGSIDYLRALAKEVSNKNLADEIEKLEPLLELVKNLIENSDKDDKLDSIVNHKEKYETVIENIVLLSKE